jgi:SAM-dependent methyltransferase
MPEARDHESGPCRICGNTADNTRHVAREMMFGTREEFAYIECSACGCLQIETIPSDLGRHYPANYYSMEVPLSRHIPVIATLRRWTSWLRLQTVNPGWGKRRERFDWLRRAGVAYDSPILDVGCGRGRLLHALHLDGFRNLTGLDPFVPRDLHYDNGIRVYRRSLGEMEGRYDLIMMHHSFEHMADPVGVLESVARLLADQGRVLVRIPLASSYAWRHYGVDWVQLDAPRHFYLHSRKSMSLLVDKVGLEIDEVVYDSYDLQFWGSEQYRRGIFHRSPQSHGENPKKRVFSRREIRRFRRLSRKLNREEDGDAACFYLKHRAGRRPADARTSREVSR